MAIETYFDESTTVYFGKGDLGLVPVQNEYDKAICIKMFNANKRKQLGLSTMPKEEFDRTFCPLTLQFSSKDDINLLIEVLKAAKAKF